MKAQNGNALHRSALSRATQLRRFFSRNGRCAMSSLRTCSITASSRPIVAARVGEMIRGRSGTNEDCMLDLTVRDRSCPDGFPQNGSRMLAQPCALGILLRIVLQAGLVAGLLADFQLHFQPYPTVRQFRFNRFSTAY